MPLSWSENVSGVIAGLKELNRTTETDFLAVGGNLMAFLSASRKLHADIAGLTALVAGEQAQHACDPLVSVGRYVEEMRHRSEGCGRPLLSLRADADRIHRGFSTFGEIASSFRIIAIQARIEAAHLDTTQQNLKNLADDVRSCSNSIRASADQVLKVAGDFDSRIAATLLEGSRIETIQLRKLPSLLAEVDADVEGFLIRQREGVKISAGLAAHMDSVERELGAVATSIQFQDITRRQLEHVIGALEDLLHDRTGLCLHLRMPTFRYSRGHNWRAPQQPSRTPPAPSIAIWKASPQKWEKWSPPAMASTASIGMRLLPMAACRTGSPELRRLLPSYSRWNSVPELSLPICRARAAAWELP